MNIASFLRMQQRLQINMQQANPSLSGDPAELEGEALADFMRWNAFALTDEVHEALAEVGWKPWASSRHVNHPQFMQEMVDAWHFFLNLLIAGAGQAGMTIDEYADAFEAHYVKKNEKNLQRQRQGYDGVQGKCPTCKRDLEEVPRHQLVACLHSSVLDAGGSILRFCNQTCHNEFHNTQKETDEHA